MNVKTPRLYERIHIASFDTREMPERNRSYRYRTTTTTTVQE